ncbi:MAG: hypothetical protein WC838_03965 [Candidatus Margulisiibacteriota bacterium]|jgi:hypothetical protein
MKEQSLEQTTAKTPQAALPSLDDLDAIFDNQAKRAWGQYDALCKKMVEQEALAPEPKTKKGLDKKALLKVKEYWQDNKDKLIS